jgi:hypothetical protein
MLLNQLTDSALRAGGAGRQRRLPGRRRARARARVLPRRAPRRSSRPDLPVPPPLRPCPAQRPPSDRAAVPTQRDPRGGVAQSATGRRLGRATRASGPASGFGYGLWRLPCAEHWHPAALARRGVRRVAPRPRVFVGLGGGGRVARGGRGDGADTACGGAASDAAFDAGGAPACQPARSGGKRLPGREARGCWRAVKLARFAARERKRCIRIILSVPRRPRLTRPASGLLACKVAMRWHSRRREQGATGPPQVSERAVLGYSNSDTRTVLENRKPSGDVSRSRPPVAPRRLSRRPLRTRGRVGAGPTPAVTSTSPRSR